MRRNSTIAGLAAALSLVATPAFALPGQAPDNAGTARASQNAGTANAPQNPGRPAGAGAQSALPGPDASAKSKGRAYGRHCQDQSKKRVTGEKGTAFSRCVTAMAKLASGATTSPRSACQTLSKKRVAGEKGTAFSRCVSEGAKLRRQQAPA
jgi:hypothetical protein